MATYNDHSVDTNCLPGFRLFGLELARTQLYKHLKKSWFCAMTEKFLHLAWAAPYGNNINIECCMLNNSSSELEPFGTADCISGSFSKNEISQNRELARTAYARQKASFHHDCQLSLPT